MSLVNQVFLSISLFLFSSVTYAQSVKVLRVVGNVLVDGKPLVEKSIPTNALIDTTAAGAILDVSIGGKSFHRFKGGQVRLEVAKDESEVTIENKVGELFSFLDPKGKQKLKVKTKSVTMGVRGTKFYVSESPDKSYLCVCEGVVDVNPSVEQSNSKSVAVKAGYDLEARPQDRGLKASKATSQMMSMAKAGFEGFGYPVK